MNMMIPPFKLAYNKPDGPNKIVRAKAMPTFLDLLVTIEIAQL